MNPRSLLDAVSVLAAPALFAWTVACGGDGRAGAAGGEPLASLDGGRVTLASACEDLFDVLAASSACRGASGAFFAPRASRERFVQYCELHLGALGTSPASVNAAERCAKAIAAATPSCGVVDPAACATPVGTGAAGAACGTALQCASGYCVGPASTAAERLGTFVELESGSALTSCGKCVDLVPVGQRCQGALPQCNAGCSVLPVPCAGNSDCSSPSGGTCVARSPAAVAGAPCGPNAPNQACGVDLICDPTSFVCVAPSGAGRPCQSNVACSGGLVCEASGRCGNGLAAGAPCDARAVCSSATLCDPRTSSCRTIAYAGPGAACDGVFANCAVGTCNLSTSSGTTGPPTGTCPRLIPDGQPCGALSAIGNCAPYATCAVAGSESGCCYVGSSTGSTTGGGGPAMMDTPVSMPTTCVLLDPSTCR